MNRNQCINVVRAINDIKAIKGLLTDCINESPASVEKRGTWQYYAEKMLSYLQSDLSGKPPFSIFAEKGNKKLPFAAHKTGTYKRRTSYLLNGAVYILSSQMGFLLPGRGRQMPKF